MKKTLLVVALVAICVLGAYVPMLVFFGMDSSTVGQSFALADIPNVADISASDLPAVESIRKLLSANLMRAAGNMDEVDANGGILENGDNEVYYDAWSESLNDVSTAVAADIVFDNMAEFADSGTVPLTIVKQIQEMKQMEETSGVDHPFIYTMTVSPTQTIYSAEDVWEYMNGLSYTMEPDTRKIVSFSFHWLPVSALDLSNEEREQLMRAYVTYLGLDILGDWEYNGRRLYSAKAGLYINVDATNPYGSEDDYYCCYSISVGL